MINVLLVDDEFYIIELLKKMIDWNEKGYKICGEADSGLKAVEMIKLYNPDVVITDINMPDMNGLNLAEHIKEYNPKIKTVFLTGYKDFEYARNAISLGITSYLLKPVCKEEIEELMQKLKLEIDNENEKEYVMEKIIVKAEISERIIKEKFINWIVTGKQSISADDIELKFKFYQIPLKNGGFNIIAIEIDDLWKADNDNQQLVNDLCQITDMTFREYQNRFVFQGSEIRVFLILGNDIDPNSISRNIQILCEELKLRVKISMGISVSIGIGSLHEGYDNLYKSYYEALYALKYKCVSSDTNVICYNSMEISNTRNIYFTNHKRDILISYLKSYNFDCINKMLSDTFLEIKKNKVSIEYLKLVSTDIIIMGLLFVSENMTSVMDIFGYSFDPLEEIKNISTFEGVKEYILSFFKQLAKCSDINKHPIRNSIVERALKFIEENIDNEDLSVSMISQRLNVNEDYLSRLVKDETGMPLIKYINKMRLEKAKELLDEGWCNIKEVARKVGYEDQLYFSKSFKKHFSICPSEYIKV